MAILRPYPLLGLFYLPKYIADWRRYSRSESAKPMSITDSQPCLTDWVTHTPFDPHYFHQGGWLARGIRSDLPESHVDVGSSVMMISVLSGMVPTVFVDYRPLKVRIDGLYPLGGDILALPFADESVSSLSSLHVIEHVGLGRYGDPIDSEGSYKAVRELHRVMAPGGKLWLALPVGRERVCFNAHRVIAPETILSWLSELELIEFSFVDDSGHFHQNSSTEQAQDLEYGCGMFLFQRSR